jgi:hypothetical protein
MNNFKENIGRVLSEISMGGPDDVPGSGEGMEDAYLKLYSLIEGDVGLFSVLSDISGVFLSGIVEKVESGDAPREPRILLNDLKKLLEKLERLESLSGECHGAAVDLAGKITG